MRTLGHFGCVHADGDSMTVISALDALSDKIGMERRKAVKNSAGSLQFLDFLQESVDALCYAFLIVPFIYNTHDRLTSISSMFCDIIKFIQVHKSTNPLLAEFLQDTHECLSTACRTVLSEENAMCI